MTILSVHTTKRRKHAQIQDSLKESSKERGNPAELDTFESQEDDIEVDVLKEGEPSLQDLLEVIKKLNLRKRYQKLQP